MKNYVDRCCGLKHQTYGELALLSGKSSGECSECAGGSRRPSARIVNLSRADTAVFGRAEDVEELTDGLQGPSFMEPEVLAHPQIHLVVLVALNLRQGDGRQTLRGTPGIDDVEVLDAVEGFGNTGNVVGNLPVMIEVGPRQGFERQGTP